VTVSTVLQLEGLHFVGSAQASEGLALVVEADHSTWDISAREARFSGAVRASRGPLLVTCDMLEARYDDDGKLVSALAQGNVVVVREQWRATAERAELALAEGAVILTGSPVLTNGAHTLRGEKIRLYVEREAVDCDRCTLVVDAAGIDAQ
jgi:lipopolysaccharide transport protein LptA